MKYLMTKHSVNLLLVLIASLIMFSVKTAIAQNDLWCMEFQDSESGITIGDNGVIKQTTDGGFSWIIKNSGTTNTLKKTALLNNDEIVVVGLGGTIIKTTNNGNTWDMKTSGIAADLYGVSFGGRESEVGIAVGKNCAILRTTDLGESWTMISGSSGKKVDYNAISLASDTKGIIAGQNGTILITTDGGFNWFNVPSYIPKVNYKFVIMLSEDVAYATGENGTIIKTTDGGLSWVSLITNSSATLYRIRFADDQIAVSVGTGGEILKTTNGGTTWTTEVSGTNNNLNCLFVIDENFAFTGGQDEIILKTTDGGITWYDGSNKIAFKKSLNNQGLKLFPNYPNPSNPVTTIKYYVPSASMVSLKIYDITGREVKMLVDRQMDAGNYSSVFDGSSLTSGVYFCRLNASSASGNFNETMKIVLVK